MADNILKGVIDLEFRGGNAINQTATAVNKAETALKKVVPTSSAATQSLINLGRVAQDAPFGFIGIANNLNPLVESFQRLKVSTGSTGGALKALGKELTGAGGLGFALSIASSLAIVFGDRLFSAGKAAKEAKSSADELKESVEGIFSSSAKEATQVLSFIAILKSETETRQRKLEAIKELQKIQPDVFNNLKLEGDAVNGLDKAYQAYLANLRTVIAAKIKQAQLEQLIEKQLKQQGVTLTASQKALIDATGRFKEAQQNDPRLQGGDAAKIKKFYSDQEAASKRAADALERDINSLISDLTELSTGLQTKPVGIDSIKLKPKKLDLDLSKIANLDFSITVPPEDVEPVATEFGTMFKKDLENYFKRTDPIDFSLIAVVNEKTFEFRGFKGLTEEQLQIAQTAEAINSVLAPAFDNMINAISRGENAFKAFGEGVKQILVGVIQKLIQTALLAGILSAITGGSFGGAKGFTQIFSGLLGGFGGFRAGGGPVSGGRSYIVGERGPELFTPGMSGAIIPNSGLRGIGGFSGGGETVLRLRGTDLVAAIAATGRAQIRLV